MPRCGALPQEVLRTSWGPRKRRRRDAASSVAPSDHRAFCERLESKIQHLRAALGRLEALEERIGRLIASGTLTEERLARARHALAKIERAQEELESQLERLLEIYAEKCRR